MRQYADYLVDLAAQGAKLDELAGHFLYFTTSYPSVIIRQYVS